MPKTKTRSVVRYVGRKKRHYSRRGRLQLPVAIIAGFIPGVTGIVNELRVGGPQAAMRQASRSFAGFDPSTSQINLTWLYGGLAPLLLGLFIHKFIGGSMGVNRMLGRMRIPLLRV